MAKDIKYNGEFVDGHMRSFKVDDETLALRVGKDKAKFTGDLAIEGQIDKVQTDRLHNNSEALKIQSSRGIELYSSTGNFSMKAGENVEFSPTDSSYSGMILGYTDIGLNEAHTTLNLTTGFVVPTDEFYVSFVAPPSGNVGISFQILFYMGSGGAGTLYAGLSTANATSGYSALASYHEKVFDDTSARAGNITVQGKWTLTGLTFGTSYQYWIGFKSSSTSGTPKIQWGGSAANRYPDFIMKAVALPNLIVT